MIEYAEKDAIIRSLVEYAKTKSETHYHSYAFGYVSAMLDDEQLLTIKRWMTREGF